MNYISEITAEMHRWFDVLNGKFFDNSLNQPIITIQKSRASTLGHFTCSQVWTKKDSNVGQYEINISAHTLHREIEDIVGTLLHEMIHYYHKENDITDAPSNKHNRKFKVFAEKIGFAVTRSNSYGWGHTKVTEELKEYILREIKPDKSIFIYSRIVPLEPTKAKTPRKKTTFKYVCPSCEMTVKGKEGILVICGDCNVKLEMEVQKD